MTSKVFLMLSNYFETLDYQLIPTDSQTVRMYATYEDENLYLINIIELSEYYVFDYKRYLDYRTITKNQFAKVGANKVFLLNLLLVDNPDMIYKDVNYLPKVSDDFEDAHWIIDTTYNELVIPKKQTKSMLGLEIAISDNIHLEELPRFKIHEKNKVAVFSGIISASMIVMFLVMEFVQGAFTVEGFIGFGGFQGKLIFQGTNFWRLITYYLIHGNPLHLLLNSVLIFYFGSKLERFVKGWEFLVIALGSSIIAGLFASLLGLIQQTDVISIGASGMIYGLIGGTLIYSRLTNEHVVGENTYGILILFLIGIAHGVAVDFVNVGLHIGGFIGGLLITPGVLWNYRTINKQSEIEIENEPNIKPVIGSNIDKKHLE